MSKFYYRTQFDLNLKLFLSIDLKEVERIINEIVINNNLDLTTEMSFSEFLKIDFQY